MQYVMLAGGARDVVERDGTDPVGLVDRLAFPGRYFEPVEEEAYRDPLDPVEPLAGGSPDPGHVPQQLGHRVLPDVERVVLPGAEPANYVDQRDHSPAVELVELGNVGGGNRLGSLPMLGHRPLQSRR